MYDEVLLTICLKLCHHFDFVLFYIQIWAGEIPFL